MHTRWYVALLTAVFFLAYIPGLGLLPFWFDVQPDVASAAATLGYNNQVAYFFLLLWSLAGIVGFALLQRFNLIRPIEDCQPEVEDHQDWQGEWSIGWLEIVVIVVVMLVLFWPGFLTNRGPYYESVYFLSILQRLESGLVPYKEFEFSYGPLLLWLMRSWTRLVGQSMNGYFWLVALLGALEFALLAALLQKLVPDFRARLSAFILLLPLLLNITLGLNYMAIRWLLPISAIVLVAFRPRSLHVSILAGILCGLGAAYSHDVGLISLVTILGVYGMLILQAGNGHDRRRWSLQLLMVLATSLITWLTVAGLILGSTLTDYVQSVTHQVERRGGPGEYAFPFHWTLNSLGVVSLIALTCIIVGRGLGRWRRLELAGGDLLLLAGLIYALLAMKSGLSRCDMAHLSSAILVLTFALILPLPRRVFSSSLRNERGLRVLLWIVVGTTALGWAPAAKGFMGVWLGGLSDSIALNSPPALDNVQMRGPSVETERAHPLQEFLALGNYLAQPERQDRPVYCYNEVWWLYIRIGVFPSVYPSDFAILSDSDAGKIASYLGQQPQTLIVMSRDEYNRLYNFRPRQSLSEPVSLLARMEHLGKDIFGRFVSVHFSYVDLERAAVARRADRMIGSYIREHWVNVGEFGDLVVLEHRSPALSSEAG